jgi:hypothetical protein
MAEPGSAKRRIYIVGGKGRNVPPWISAAFDHEQFHQDLAKTRSLDPEKKPDAVVVLSSWVGHEHFYGARDLAERLDIPMILSPGGWSASLKSAADLGVEWFINDIENAKNNKELTASQSDATVEFIDNAWREAYNREWSAREALVKRYSKTKKALDHAEQELSLLKEKEAAANRVITEVRAAAAQQRAEMEKNNQEIQQRSERIANALAQHVNTMKELFSSLDGAHQLLAQTTSQVGDVRGTSKSTLDFLLASLEIAEEGVPDDLVPANSESTS